MDKVFQAERASDLEAYFMSPSTALNASGHWARNEILNLRAELEAVKRERDEAFNAGIEAAAKHIESDMHNYALCIRTLRMKP